MISVLLPKANDTNPAVAATILKAIGELATVGGEDMLPYKDKLMPIIIAALKDHASNVKREAALHTLGQLASNSGYVIDPYLEYPELLDLLQYIIRTEPQRGPLRQETIKLMGILGALDPYRHQVQNPQDDYTWRRVHGLRRHAGEAGSPLTLVQSPVLEVKHQGISVKPLNRTPKNHREKSQLYRQKANQYDEQQVEERAPDAKRRVETNRMTDISLMMTGLTPSNKEYYPTVVINALLNILKDSSLAPHHAAVIEAIMNIFRTLGLECVQFLDRIIPAFLEVIRDCPQSRLESYFNQLATLVSIVRQHIRNYLPQIIDTLHNYWDTSPSLQATILSLVEAISRSLEGEFKIYLAGLLPAMLGVLEKDATTKRIPSEKVLHAFLVFGSSSEEYMHLIIPVVVRTFEKQGQPTFLRKSAIETIGKISRQVNLNDYAAKIIHPLTRILASGESSLRVAALDTLCALIQQLGRDYLHFMGTVNKVLQANQIQHQNYELLISKLQKGEALPQDLSSETRFIDQLDEPSFADLG
ncbi:hypothetical protein PC116_g29695, partial [Phytophthora cactorum]